MEWREIVGYPTHEISEYGDIRRAVDAPTGPAKIGYVYKKKLMPNGYYLSRLYKKGHTTYVMLHRLVAYAYLPTPLDAQHTIVNHKDGDKANNHYSNLEWVSQQENIIHSLYNLKNIHQIKRGEHCTRCVLSDKDVVEIVGLYKGGSTLAEIHSIFSQVSRTHIGRICRGSRRDITKYKGEYI